MAEGEEKSTALYFIESATRKIKNKMSILSQCKVDREMFSDRLNRVCMIILLNNNLIKILSLFYY